jgi:hypothetical protein
MTKGKGKAVTVPESPPSEHEEVNNDIAHESAADSNDDVCVYPVSQNQTTITYRASIRKSIDTFKSADAEVVASNQSDEPASDHEADITDDADLLMYATRTVILF